MLWGVILICICTGYGIKNIKRFQSVLKGCRELKNIKTMSCPSVKLQNMLNGSNSAKGAFFWAIAAAIGTGFICFVIMEWFFNIFLFIAFFMMFLLSLADLAQAVLLYRYGDECYLTAKGIAAVEGTYEKGKCRFVMEAEPAKNGDKYIDVYKENLQYPFRFRVLEKEEEAVQMVNHFNS